ncbi:K1586-like protein, partial [Mya arenaria]
MANFLKYFDGAKPGSKRKVDSQGSKQDSKKLYEAKHEREFQSSWQKSRPCIFYQNGLLDSVKTHENSKQHIRSSDRHINLNEQSTSKASTCLAKLNKAQIGQLSIKMRAAHFSASSSDIHGHICETFVKFGLENDFKTKLVGFCSDGASNMQGHKSGLVALLRKTHPHIVTVHCLAHRLELAFKDTIKKVPLYEKMMTLLLGLYYLYRKSPKLKMGLKRSFEAHQTKVLLPTRVGGTRWLPHLDLAIRNFIRGYKAVRSHLESASHSHPKAEGLAKISADSNVLGFVLSLK